jgi:hypothetical protein
MEPNLYAAKLYIDKKVASNMVMIAEMKRVLDDTNCDMIKEVLNKQLGVVIDMNILLLNARKNIIRADILQEKLY